MIEEKERPHGLPFRGWEKAANLGLAHFPHSRLQDQDVSHLIRHWKLANALARCRKDRIGQRRCGR